ncbi:MAG: 2-phosphosulfolactate phosphatase [Chloroflexi bacterium]|nr:2-phosphosulfolactate phosphatase [Chloroflexota bacterium]
MEIRIGSLTRDANEALGAALVIDVFRAFTTAAIAFNRGAERITLVAEVEEALEIRRQNPGIADILMGEVDGKRPEGFNHGNSPFEVSSVDFAGKSVVQSTRAGTVGTAAAGAAGCDPIYVTSLVVAGATVRALLAEDPLPDRVTVLAMGDQGVNRSDEDEHCGMYLRNRLEGRSPDPEALRKLIMAGGATQKFFDEAQPQYHPRDASLALEVDRYDFAMRVSREDGLLVARRVGG